MNRTKIEWTDITLNPIKGYCPMNCTYCYAHDFYNRFKWDKTIRFIPDVLDEIKKLKNPTKIFLCSTIEMFHSDIPQIYRDKIYESIEKYPQHVFQILTKCSQNVQQIHQPKNVWLGFSTTGEGEGTLNPKIMDIQDANIRFMSLEPFLQRFCYEDLVNINWDDLDWVIIGGQTGKQKIIPNQVMINDVVKKCRDCSVSVFIKDNCRYPKKIQEFPEFKNCKYCSNVFYKKEFPRVFQNMITCGTQNCKDNLKRERMYSNHCSDCGKVITNNANKCKSCLFIGKNNPFYGKTHTEETKKKLKLFYKGMTSFQKGKTYEEMYGIKKAQELKRKNGLRKKGRKQSKETIRKRLKRRTPSSLEKKAIELIKKFNLPYIFVGNGEFFIENKNPDFINYNGEKIAIEVFYRKHKEFLRHGLKKWIEERKKLFNKYGWQILFFDETQVNEKNFVERLIK